jgi:4-hydroxy-tetrahydrodipicolinate synthase
MQVRPTGVIPPMTTPFRKDGEIDFKLVAPQVDWLIGAGSHGLAAGGSTGEGHTLDHEEYRDLLAATVEAAKGRVPVIAGIIVNSTRDAIKRGKLVRDMKVAALQVTPVHYLFKPDDEAMVEHFRRMADETGMPIIIYNVVPWSYLSPKLLTRIMAEVPLVVGVKQSAGDLKLFADLMMMAPDKLIYSAVDALMYPSYTLGAHGSIAAILTAAPHVASVELRGLTKRYGTLAVVDNVSMRIEHGSLVCLLGPSGCGKTTTLRLIAGFVEPSEGEILVGESLVSTPERSLPPERRNMSMIFQSYALWPHMTVAENITYGLKLRKLDGDTIRRKLDAILGTTRLEALASRYPGELSGGQQQRVALARALVVEPETLLLDEPLSNLDANLREEMRFEVRRLHDEYRYTTVYVTHDQVEAMTTADVIAVMNHGRIEQAGSPEDIYDRRVRSSSPASSA